PILWLHLHIPRGQNAVSNASQFRDPSAMKISSAWLDFPLREVLVVGFFRLRHVVRTINGKNRNFPASRKSKNGCRSALESHTSWPFAAPRKRPDKQDECETSEAPNLGRHNAFSSDAYLYGTPS